MKQSFTGIAAVIIAVILAAFTVPRHASEHPRTNNYYRYSLTTNTGDTNPMNYVYTTDLTGCSGSSVVCIISSPGPNTVGSHPSFPNGTNPYSNSVGVSVTSQKPAQ